MLPLPIAESERAGHPALFFLRSERKRAPMPARDMGELTEEEVSLGDAVRGKPIPGRAPTGVERRKAPRRRHMGMFHADAAKSAKATYSSSLARSSTI